VGLLPFFHLLRVALRPLVALEGVDNGPSSSTESRPGWPYDLLSDPAQAKEEGRTCPRSTRTASPSCCLEGHDQDSLEAGAQHMDLQACEDQAHIQRGKGLNERCWEGPGICLQVQLIPEGKARWIPHLA
jgi:hypothetical protein